MTEGAESFVAECFWPDVQEADLVALDGRVRRAAADGGVRYLGSILIRDDEVVLCRFEGSVSAVRALAVRAEIPFDRILGTTSSPWPTS